jgi:hypothetical protein
LPQNALKSMANTSHLLLCFDAPIMM